MADDDTSEQDTEEGASPSGGDESAAVPGKNEDDEKLGLLGRALEVWRNPAYRFVLLFLPYLSAVAIGYPLFVLHFNPVIQWFILKTAWIEYRLFALFASDVRVDEKLVFFGSFAVKIIDECTGIYEMLIFAAAVMAFPTSLRKRLIGLLMGCPLIYVFNVLRIAVLLLVGRYWSGSFEFMHLYFWQATMIVMITGVWLLWIVKVVRDEENPASDPA